MKTAAAMLTVVVLFALRRPLLRLYLAVRDVLTDAPLSDPEACVYRRIEE